MHSFHCIKDFAFGEVWNTRKGSGNKVRCTRYHGAERMLWMTLGSFTHLGTIHGSISKFLRGNRLLSHTDRADEALRAISLFHDEIPDVNAIPPSSSEPLLVLKQNSKIYRGRRNSDHKHQSILNPQS